MTMKVVIVLFIAFVLASLAAEAMARKGPRDPSAQRPTKTREHKIRSEIDPNLISIKLETSDLSEARAILLDMGMDLVTREGTLDYWYLVRPISSGQGQNKRDIMEEFSVSAANNDKVIYWERVFRPATVKKMIPTDPSFRSQWTLRTNLSDSSQLHVLEGSSISMDVTWDLGYSGRGVHIQFIDDGLDGANAEFAGRFSLSDSYNWGTSTSDPYSSTDNHGTQSAGVAVAAMNNSACIAGIAYGARVSGIRYLGTSATSAQALTSNSRNVNISSNSWGYVLDLGIFTTTPQATIDALSTVADRGVITVFAAGNTHRSFGTCANEDLVNYPQIINVGASNHLSVRATYSVGCPAMTVVSPSGDNYYKGKIITNIAAPKTGGSCDNSFGGTSAACPAVAGVIALMKEANPKLTYRDVRSIFSRTSTKIDPTHPSWTTNAAGVAHSNAYGYGRVNPTAAINMAKTWNSLRPATVTSTSLSGPFYRAPNASIPDGTGVPVSDTLRVALPQGSVIEHVGLFVSSSHPAPTQLTLSLTSPSGTVTEYFGPVATTTLYKLSSGSKMFAFASPYYDGTQVSSVSKGGQWDLSDNCTLSAIPQPNGANPWLIVNTYDVDARCSNAVEIIEEAARLTYVAVAFFGYDDIVDWKTTRKTSTIPSFFVPIWQTGIGASLGSSTSVSRVGPYVPDSGDLDMHYMGNLKLLGENPNGDWTIRVSDSVPGLSGSLTNWLIQFHYLAPEVAPVPSGGGGGTTPTSSSPVRGSGSTNTSDASEVRVWVPMIVFGFFAVLLVLSV